MANNQTCKRLSVPMDRDGSPESVGVLYRGSLSVQVFWNGVSEVLPELEGVPFAEIPAESTFSTDDGGPKSKILSVEFHIASNANRNPSGPALHHSGIYKRSN